MSSLLDEIESRVRAEHRDGSGGGRAHNLERDLPAVNLHEEEQPGVHALPLALRSASTALAASRIALASEAFATRTLTVLASGAAIARTDTLA
eukprot:CAMPEP_0180175556 /NCGR_PEP_ID=MMETSP0986-20121125/36782_1 /TAXON_ID=697907 /ORGANISM="non described non described, Strain CCMP2293" /LENGTH=92 /DNA_ID=CAMNT_0022128039 /DNA_START=180 /DNA_END=456 /DNA_ORIENTATION=+